jgi:hypothetical protein
LKTLTKINNLDLTTVKYYPISEYLTVVYDRKNEVYKFNFTKDCNVQVLTEGDFTFKTKGNLSFEANEKIEIVSNNDNVVVYGNQIHLRSILNRYKEELKQELLSEIHKVPYV